MHDVICVFAAGDAPEELLDSFFEAEVEMERNICRDMVCMSRKDEEGKINTEQVRFVSIDRSKTPAQ